MKASHYSVVFFILSIALLTILGGHVSGLVSMTNEKINNNRSIDIAADTAMEYLVEVADGDILQINLDESVARFYNALFTMMGVIDSPSERERISRYIPVIAVMLNDGFYVQYKIIEDGQIRAVWSQKFPYGMTSSVQGSLADSLYNFTINYRLDDSIQLLIDGSPIAYEGSHNHLADKYGISNADSSSGGVSAYGRALAAVLKADEFGNEFYERKQRAVINAVEEKIRYYINQYNEVAQSYGINYTFSLPEGAGSDLANTLDGIAFIALFQGYPFGTGTDDVYNRFCVSGAQISKNTEYFIARDPNGYLFYHRRDCKCFNLSDSRVALSRESAALEGANPCIHCRP